MAYNSAAEVDPTLVLSSADVFTDSTGGSCPITSCSIKKWTTGANYYAAYDTTLKTALVTVGASPLFSFIPRQDKIFGQVE